VGKISLAASLHLESPMSIIFKNRVTSVNDPLRSKFHVEGSSCLTELRGILVIDWASNDRKVAAKTSSRQHIDE
jgi:hypothetical protein